MHTHTHTCMHTYIDGVLWGLSCKESACQCRRCAFDPWAGKIPWRRKWQPTPVFLHGKSHGQRSLGVYSPLGHRVEHELSDCTTTTKVHIPYLNNCNDFIQVWSEWLSRYDSNQILYNYTVEVTSRFKGLDLIDRVPEELWAEFHIILQRQWSKPSPRRGKMQQGKMVVWGRKKNRSERQRRKGKIYPSECRVPEYSKERWRSLLKWTI